MYAFCSSIIFIYRYLNIQKDTKGDQIADFKQIESQFYMSVVTQ